MTKRLLFDRNPLDDEARARLAQQHSELIAQFTHRIATRRRGPHGKPARDPFWPSSLRKAAKELGIETIGVNEGLFTRSADEKNALFELAEQIWRERHVGIRRSG